MRGRWTILLLILGVVAAVLGFGVIPGLADPVETAARVAFFILLFLFVIVVATGRQFRRG